MKFLYEQILRNFEFLLSKVNHQKNLGQFLSACLMKKSVLYDRWKKRTYFIVKNRNLRP